MIHSNGFFTNWFRYTSSIRRRWFRRQIHFILKIYRYWIQIKFMHHLILFILNKNKLNISLIESGLTIKKRPFWEYLSHINSLYCSSFIFLIANPIYFAFNEFDRGGFLKLKKNSYFKIISKQIENVKNKWVNCSSL